MRCFFAGVVAVFLFAPAAAFAQASPATEPLKAGFAEADITPALVAKKPVYLAGYGMNRKAAGVHDPIMARCVVLEGGGEKIALACVDLIGLQYPQVKEIRAKLPEFRYVLVSSTHNHEGPDVIGIWGRGPFHRGVDEAYLSLVVERVVASIKEAAGKLTPVTAAFGTAEDESLVNDSRLPIVKDGVLRAVKLHHAGTATPAMLIVDWSSHPEALGRSNRQLTADFPHATVAALKKRYGCPVLYLSGAVGGLLAPPRGNVKDAAGNVLHEGDFEYARVYGDMVADLAAEAIDSAEPLALAPFVVSARPIAVPVENPLYRVARAFGVLNRPATVWTGDFQQFGDSMTLEKKSLPSAVESEVAYLRLGELHVACIPGEIYPELVYGKYQEPVEPAADFHDAPLEPSVASLMPGKNWMLIGLANDELGYIIPKRQWDKAAPFAYGKEAGQYGEINSCSPQAAPIVMEALKRRVEEAGK
ncbi:MAG: hypothetical protein L0211_23305 [Planctomycetaceae bacterium]|nr:hypothetical protein [Planctomycetaceae bacterium]